MRFLNVSFRLNLEQFFPNDSIVYDVFGLFQCKLSKTGNLVLFHITTVLLDIYTLQGQVKVENQFVRISRLRKFVISKSQNPKI